MCNKIVALMPGKGSSIIEVDTVPIISIGLPFIVLYFFSAEFNRTFELKNL